MTFYYVLAGAFVLFAIILTVIGLTRDDFPPRPSVGRAVIVAAAVIATVTFVVLLRSTHVEHPREEAAAEAAEKKAEREREQAQGEAAGGAPAGEPVEVIEKEFSIEFEQTAFKAGKQEFDVDNQGKLPHDLAVEDGGTEAKTPILDAGEKASLEVDLQPGRYKLYCTVPGHEELGMKKEVTVD